MTHGAWALDLKEAYEAALEQDAATNAARAAAASGREALPQARAQLLPNVSANFSRSKNKLSTVRPNVLGQLSDTSYDYPSSNDTLSIRQPLFRKYQWAQYVQAQAQVDEVNAVLDTELQNLAVKVAGTYFEALLAGDQLTLIETHLGAYRTQLDAARKMFDAGSGTRTDIDEVQARLDMGLAQELEARQHVAWTRQQLQVLVNQPVERLAKVAPAQLKLLPPDPGNVEHWIERAEQASPELRGLRARLQVATLEVEKASAGHYPTLDAVAQWTRSSSENIQSIESSNESRAIGLQLNIPLFSGGGVNSAIRQALASKERALQSLEAGRRDMGVRVYKEFRGASEGVLRVRALEQAVKSAEQVLVSSQRAFQAGNRTRLDILNAENNTMIALRDLAQARYVYLLATLRLKALVEDAGAQSIAELNEVFVPNAP